MKLSHTITLGAPRAHVLDVLCGKDYLDALVQGLEPVSLIEEIAREESPGHLRRTLRYSAPTAGKIPSFLSKWKDKAPGHVHWQEEGDWDLAACRLNYVIRAEIPQGWQEYYETKGVVELRETGTRECTMHTELEVDVRVFGLGSLIERAAKKEVEKILRQQAQVTKEFVEG